MQKKRVRKGPQIVLKTRAHRKELQETTGNQTKIQKIVWISPLIQHTKPTAVRSRSRYVTCNALYPGTWTKTGLPIHNMSILKLCVLEYVCLDLQLFMVL